MKTEKKYKCLICDKFFKTQEDCKHHIKLKHINVLDKGITHTCKICREKFNSFKEIQEHFKKKHISIGKEKYNCIFCKEKFHSKYNFEKHIFQKHKDKMIVYCAWDYRDW